MVYSDPNTVYDVNDPAVDDYVNGGMDDTTSNGAGGDTTVPDATQVGAAATDLTQAPNDDNQNRNGISGVPNPGGSSMSGPPDQGVVGISGNPNTGAALTAEQSAFQRDYPAGGSFPNTNPIDAARFNGPDGIGQATAQGPSLGNGRPQTVEERYFQDKYPNGGSFNAQGQPTPSIPNPGITSGGGQPQGREYLAAGPGFSIGGGYGGGLMANSNMPMSTLINQGWTPGYIGQDTIVPTRGIQDAGYDPRTGTFHEGFGGNQDRGYMPYSEAVARGVGPNLNDFGPHPLTGGAWGGGAPSGYGINMGGVGSGDQQLDWNAHNGNPILGGAAGAGNPAYAAWFSDNPQAPNRSILGGNATAPGYTGVMNPDGSFTPPGGFPSIPNPGIAASAGSAGGGQGGNPNRTGLAGAPGGTPGGGTNPLMDQGSILRNPDGSIRGVASPNGSFTQAFQGYDNIIRNAQQGDPFALRDAKVLAAAGDRNAQAVVSAIGGLPDFARSQQAVGWDQAHNQQIANRAAGTEFAGNRAALGNLAGQAISNVPQNPVSNFDALLGPDAHAQAMAALNQMGATQVKVQDGKLSWVSASGTPNEIPFSITNSGALVQALQGDAAARQQIASQNTGGRGRSTGYAGGGGTNRPAPAVAAPPEQNVPVNTQYGPGNRNTQTGVLMF